MKKIEILMSTYNGEQYIAEQIDSIICQTYSNWHLTIRDDGSTDKTVDTVQKFCLEYPDKISIMAASGNLRSKKSFEKLLLESKADYYMFSDQDDVWEKDKVESALNEIIKAEEKNPDIPIVICSDLMLVDKNLKSLDSTLWKSAKICVDILKTPKQLAVNNYVAGCTMLFNNRAKDISLPFGENAIMHDSWISLMVLARGGKIIIQPQSHIKYRQHGNNVVGAADIKIGVKYFAKKIVGIKTVLHNNYANYKQANEIFGMGLLPFTLQRIKYLIKR